MRTEQHHAALEALRALAASPGYQVLLEAGQEEMRRLADAILHLDPLHVAQHVQQVACAITRYQTLEAQYGPVSPFDDPYRQSRVDRLIETYTTEHGDTTDADR